MLRHLVGSINEQRVCLQIGHAQLQPINAEGIYLAQKKAQRLVDSKPAAARELVLS